MRNEESTPPADPRVRLPREEELIARVEEYIPYLDPMNSIEDSAAALLRDCLEALRANQAEREQLEQWRRWAQFVYLVGGPVLQGDRELQTGVCEAHDQEHAELRQQLAASEAAHQAEREVLHGRCFELAAYVSFVCGTDTADTMRQARAVLVERMEKAEAALVASEAASGTFI